jgi:DNA integrity scanning protein DisA with diadenylate cyclase activity
MTIAQLSKQSGLKYQTLYQRIKILGWDRDIAISTPLVSPRSYKKILNKIKKAPNRGFSR